MRKVEYAFNGETKIGYVVKESKFRVPAIGPENKDTPEIVFVCPNKEDAEKMINTFDWTSLLNAKMEIIPKKSIIRDIEE